jgi:DNA-binding NtrC family response regulator
VQRILIADDEPLYLRTTGELLRKAGYECVCVADGVEASRRLREEPFDLVLSDLNMPGNHNLELLREHSGERPHAPLIVVTGAPTLPSAIESIRLGITDYLLKPVKYEDLLVCVRRALASRTPTAPISLPASARAKELAARFPGVIGQSPPMLDLLEIIDRVAETNTNVMLTGESGVGKEVVARALHQRSDRREGPFQIIDCTAVPETLFESMLFGHVRGSFTGAVKDQVGLLTQSDGGTAFFDELGELPLAGQAKLLRAVQERSFTPVGSAHPVAVDARFICATNRDIEAEVRAGRFRQDLFYRLGVIHLEIPPLRERGDDVLLLADHLIQQLSPAERPLKALSADARELLSKHRWPGNIRELRNAIEHAIALAKGAVIEVDDLPVTVRRGGSEPTPEPAVAAAANQPHREDPPTFQHGSREEALEAAERDYFASLLGEHRGNVSQAARHAGLSRQGLHKLLSKHGLKASDFRD